jgi:hypothetical protein
MSDVIKTKKRGPVVREFLKTSLDLQLELAGGLLGLSVVVTLPFLKNPGMGLVGNLSDQRQVISAEAAGRLPLTVIVGVQTLNGYIMTNSILLCGVRPHGGLDPPEANFMNGPCGLVGIAAFRSCCCCHFYGSFPKRNH